MTGKKIATALMLTTALVVSACDKMSNKATPERLDALVESGTNPDRLAKAEERLGKVLGRQNSIAELADLGDSAITDPQDIALNDLLSAAMENNPDIAQAAQDLNQADARRLAAIFGYLPQVSANFSMTQVQTQVIRSDNLVFQQGTATYPVVNMAVELRQPLINMSKIYGIQLATTVRTSTEIAYVAAVQKATFETFDAYLVAATSRVRMDELSRRASLLGAQASGEGALEETGLNDEQTVRSLLAEQARVQGDLSLETARYAEALGELAYLTGTAISGVQPGGVPQSVMGAERSTTVEEAVAAAQKNNPELVKTAIQVVERDLNRKQAIAADFMPVLDLFAKVEREDRSGSRFGGGSLTQDVTAGVALTLPIFNASGDGLRTVEASVDLRSGIVNYHATKRRLETDIAMTLERMAQMSTAIGQMSRALQQARANVASERTLIANGQSTELQLVSRQVLESQLRQEAEVQRLEYLRAWARLQYLTGAMSADAGL